MQNTLAVGIDPGKWTNYGVAIIYPEKILLSKSFPNTWEGILEFDRQVARVAHKRMLDIVYGIEGSRSCARPLCQILYEVRKRRLFEVNPVKTNRQKDFYGQDKSDEVDARAIAAIVLRSGTGLPVIEAGTSTFNDIREVERHFTDLSKRETQLLNKLHYYLSQVYMAHYKEFFSSIKGKGALRFFESYPLPQYLKNEDNHSLVSFLLETGCRRGPVSKEKAQADIERKVKKMEGLGKRFGSLPLDRALRVKAQVISQLCREIRRLQEDMAHLDKFLEKELIPETGMKLTTFQGVSTRLASIIIGESQDVGRFRSSSAYAKYNGTAPAEKASGGRCHHKARKACNRHLKRAFFLMALTSMHYDPLSKEYVDRCRLRGISKRESIKRLARRLSDVIYAMMRDKTAYNREKVLTRKRMKEKKEGEVAISLNVPIWTRDEIDMSLTSPDRKTNSKGVSCQIEQRS